MEVEDTLEFVITIKRSGKLCHSFHSNNYVYRRKEVKASGVAYFVCAVDRCPMRLHARTRTKMQPILTKNPQYCCKYYSFLTKFIIIASTILYFKASAYVR